MLAPGDTRYYLPLVKQSWCTVQSTSFYIKPGYKMHVKIANTDNCSVYFEKGEHDHQLKWPMPEMEIELSTTENEILYRETICTRCGLTVNQLEGDKTQQAINLRSLWALKGLGVLRSVVFLTVKEHLCTGIRLA